MISNPDLDGSFTEYPLVVGISDTIIFSPRDSSVMFNLDYEDSSKSSYVLKATSQFTPTDFANYGILTNVENDIFKLQFTDRAYYVGETVTLDTIFNLSAESMYLDTDVPQATFDTQGSVAFKNTYVDHRNNNGVIGIGHSVFQQSFYPYYLS